MAAKFALDRHSGVALWRQIAQDLSASIEGGNPPSGEKLPSELALADQYLVNRHTIRQAVNMLSNHGLVRVERGRGTFVQKRLAAFSLETGRVYSQSLLIQDLQHGDEVLSIGTMKADEKQAAGLDVQPGSELAFVESLRSADGNAIMLSKSFFPLNRCPGIIEKINRLKSINEALVELGHPDHIIGQTRITAELPTPEVAGKLSMPLARPILKIVKLNTSASGQPLAFTLTCFAGDLCQLTLTHG